MILTGADHWLESVVLAHSPDWVTRLTISL
jgi:hypothetical protein